MRERKMMYVLILIMITICVVVSGIAVYILYETSFEQQQRATGDNRSESSTSDRSRCQV